MKQRDRINEEYRLKYGGNRKHPYYDSDRKKKTEELSMKMIAYSIIGMVILMVLGTLLGCGNQNKEVETAPMEYNDTIQDIKWQDTIYGNRCIYPDEYVVWIGSNGDTIWE